MARYLLDARTATDHFPGIGRYVANLARAMTPLLAPGERLILFQDQRQPSPWDLHQLTGERVTLVEAPVSPFSPRQQWLVPSLVRRLGASLYHCPYYLMPYLPGVPTLVTVYDLIPLLLPQHVSASARLLFRWMTALALRTADQVIAISQATQSDLVNIYRLPTEKLAVIALSADPAFHPQPASSVDAVRRKYDLPEEYVLYLGSNKPHKNLTRLVEAFSRVTRKIEGVNLVIAGVWDPRYPEPRYRAEAIGLNESVAWLGSVPEADLPALYTGATVFVFPSLYEGFGLPVLEAMACGIPVACANTSALPEVAGDAALLFDPNVVDSVAQALSQLLEDPELRAHLTQQGLRRAAQFSWDRTARETLNQYRELLDAAAHRAKAGGDEPVDTGH